MADPVENKSTLETYYTRFDRSQRIEHLVFLISFSILGFTGLIQKFSLAPVSQLAINALGGIESVRTIHHYAAVVMLLASIYHILSLLYRVYVMRVSWTMLPVPADFRDVYHDIMHYFGMRKHKAYYGRYNYAEKAEYLAVVWGTIVMAVTGFMMWNPIATTRFLPGESIPAAKAAHGGEALLAVLAILIWHFYHVHIRHFNKSMFTGTMSETDMEHEHPAELEQIKSGQVPPPPSPEVVRRRQRIYYPVAGVLALILISSVYGFVTIETTAITTLPEGEQAEVFVPATPTPLPIPEPTTADAGVSAPEVIRFSWDGYFYALFDNRCGDCHGQTLVSGLSLASYKAALKGGDNGAGIVPGDPLKSQVVIRQSQGDHPGQLTPQELERVVDWIKAGAPEQ